MRVEPFTVGSHVHVMKKGGRGLPIVNSDADRRRFLRVLFYMNDVFVDHFWVRETKGLGIFGRPEKWPPRQPLVHILCYILMQNHFHLLLKEITEGGISKFMQKVSESMTMHFNEKYKNKGSIFQGAYKGRTVGEDFYLRYLAAYIMVKNAFELFPGGLEKARAHFEEAWRFALNYPFSSLANYVTGSVSPIIDKDIFGELFARPKEFKSFAREVIEGGLWEKKTKHPVSYLTIE